MKFIFAIFSILLYDNFIVSIDIKVNPFYKIYVRKFGELRFEEKISYLCIAEAIAHSKYYECCNAAAFAFSW
jgi:hypothetical protein